MSAGQTNATLGLVRGSWWIPARFMSGMLSRSGADISEGDNTPVHAANSLGGSELTCVTIDTGEAGATPMEIYHFMYLPREWDMSYPLDARIVFVHAAAAADAGIDWTFHYKFYGLQSALTDCKVSGDGAITFAAHTASATDDSIEATAWTALDTVATYAATDLFWGFAVTCTDMGASSANEIELMGVEFRYTQNLLCDRSGLTTEKAAAAFNTAVSGGIVFGLGGQAKT